MQSVSSEQVRSVADTRGKHRISAELKRLEQEARFLEVSLCSYIYPCMFVCARALCEFFGIQVLIIEVKFGS